MRTLSKCLVFQMSFACIALLSSCTTDEGEYSHAPNCTSGRLRCLSHVRTDVHGYVQTYATPQGLGASDLQDAYALDVSVDPGATIAIIGAYGYPSLESDLSHYRSAYGLPACTSASGCLTIVNQMGQ